MAISQTDLNKIYLAYFGRPVDASGLATFSKMEIGNVIGAFDSSKESQDLYGTDPVAKINAIYKNLFGREAEPEGLKGWLDRLATGEVTPASAALEILNRAQNSDAKAIENKIAAADAFTTELLKNTGSMVGYSGNDAAKVARDWLAKVNAESKIDEVVKGVNAAVVAVSSAGGTSVTGNTFTLTTGTDFADVAGAQRDVGAGTTMASDFKFTNGNEVIAATTATATATDSLTDGSTTDNDTYNLVANGASALGTIANIENFNITASGATGYGINWTAITGAKTVTVTGAVEGNINLTNAGANLGFGGNATTGAGATTIDASGLTGNAGAITYSLANSATTTDVTVKAGGSGGSTITTGGGNDTIVGSAGADTLNGGAGNDTISGGAGNDIINGGAGNDTIDTGTGNNTVTGGSGNDTIALNGTIDTVVFNGVGLVGANGKDTITGFDAGTGAGADILNVHAHTAVGGAAAAATGTVTLTAAGALNFGNVASTTANTVLILDRAQAISGQDYSTAADFAKVFGATSAIHTTQLTSATTEARLLVVQGTDQTQLYFVDAGRDGTDTDITTNDVVLVGVLTDVTNTTAFAAGNFLV